MQTRSQYLIDCRPRIREIVDLDLLHEHLLRKAIQDRLPGRSRSCRELDGLVFLRQPFYLFPDHAVYRGILPQQVRRRSCVMVRNGYFGYPHRRHHSRYADPYGFPITVTPKAEAGCVGYVPSWCNVRSYVNPLILCDLRTNYNSASALSVSLVLSYMFMSANV